MTNLKLFHFIWKLSVVQGYNQLIYWLQKLPILGKHIPNSAYRGQSVKWLLQLIGAVHLVTKSFFQTLVYLLILSGLALWLRELPFNALGHSHLFWLLLMVASLFWGSAIQGLLVDSNDQESLLAIRVFSLPVKRYYLLKLGLDNLLHLLIFSSILSWFATLSTGTALSAWTFTIFTLGIRLALQAGLLFLYQLNKPFPTRRPIIYSLIWALFGPILGGLLYFLELAKVISGLYSPWAAVIGVVLTLSALFVLGKTTQLEKVCRRMLTLSNLQIGDNEAIRSVDLEVRDKDYHFDVSVRQGDQIRSRQGIVYLNELFYDRLSPHLKKRVLLKSLFVGLLLLAAIIALLIFKPQPIQSLTDLLSFIFPLSLTIGYFIYSSEYFTRFCFYHLDRKLLKYPFYRQSDMVMSSLRIRFKKVVRLHLPILLIVLVGMIVIYVLSGGRSLVDLVFILLIEIVIMLFFSFHHLILYYLIQPFTESMKTKSPTYNIINGLTYFLCFQFHHISKGVPMLFVWIMLGVITLYMPLGIWAVIAFAPKHFRLRD